MKRSMHELRCLEIMGCNLAVAFPTVDEPEIKVVEPTVTKTKREFKELKPKSFFDRVKRMFLI